MIEIMLSRLGTELSRLAERDQHVAAREALFRAGDPVLSLFLVVSGSLQLTRPLPHGSELVLQRAGPGAILAEASLFAETYHCDAIATQPSLVRVLPRHRLDAALASSPELAQGWACRLAQELQRSRAMAEILSLKTVAERVSAWIVLNESGLPPKGCWRQIASELAVTPEALYRELARRRSDGPIA